MILQNKCALYWPDGDTTTDKYNIYHGTITVTLKDESKPAPSYIRRVFEVVKQQVRIILLHYLFIIHSILRQTKNLSHAL